jgi:hypothetical protein
MRRIACTIVLAWASAATGAQETPHYVVTRDGVLQVSALPAVLSRPEVRPHLTTGLTTSLILTIAASRDSGAKARGAARIDVRWEPWDEVFHTTVIPADGRPRRETVGSFDRLAAWWRALDLPVAHGLAAGPWEVRVELSVVPFSQSEERDAQRWFATTPGGGEAPARAAGEGATRLDSVVDLLMATSIQRQSIVRYAWRAQPVSSPPRPRGGSTP